MELLTVSKVKDGFTFLANICLCEYEKRELLEDGQCIIYLLTYLSSAFALDKELLSYNIYHHRNKEIRVISIFLCKGLLRM